MTPFLFRPFHPILYQGVARMKNYFEGWYFKQVAGGPGTANPTKGARGFAFIPGISRSDTGDHAFIQTIDGMTGASRYFTFPASAFSFSDSPFGIRIADNRFSLTGLSADLADEAGGIRADLAFTDAIRPVRSLFRPGVMGPYAFAPFMECSHGIASLDHSVDGTLELRSNGNEADERIAFASGRGYIEKDWGRSMPSAWVWIQSNSFESTAVPASFSFSLARVPWRGSSFNGFICLLLAKGVEYRFANYTRARIDLLENVDGAVRILLGDRTYKMEILVRRSSSATLQAPVEGAMSRRITESVDSWVRIVLKRRRGRTDEILFDSSAVAAGAELVGDIDSLKP